LVENAPERLTVALGEWRGFLHNMSSRLITSLYQANQRGRSDVDPKLVLGTSVLLWYEALELSNQLKKTWKARGLAVNVFTRKR